MRSFIGWSSPALMHAFIIVTGYTSVWSLAIYGISGMIMEHIYAACKKSRVPLLLRGICYLLWVYMWEFSTGFILKQFNACPWDYSEFNYNVQGLITFEYAPLWFFVSILMERVVIAHVSELHWATSSSYNGLAARLKDWRAKPIIMYIQYYIACTVPGVKNFNTCKIQKYNYSAGQC